ncbi:hypothetical protein H253_0129 [Klebsiella pneumoniae KP-7]|nr:hypothetical protein H253_0129 [Klebsiella pneumoniae KP-7]EOZ76731.1 hypothetical protein H254_5580 [Klebsiella pneumoniae KP-11]
MRLTTNYQCIEKQIALIYQNFQQNFLFYLFQNNHHHHTL